MSYGLESIFTFSFRDGCDLSKKIDSLGPLKLEWGELWYFTIRQVQNGSTSAVGYFISKVWFLTAMNSFGHTFSGVDQHVQSKLEIS
jgi:hypothetical protein